MIYTYTNEYGDSLTFGAGYRYRLKDVSGISGNTMTLADAYTPAQVGTTITSSKVDAKTVELKGDFESTIENRDTLLSVLIPGRGRLLMDDGVKRVYLDVYVSDGPDLVSLNPLYDEFTVQLYADYPYWIAENPLRAGFVEEHADFSFPNTFYADSPFYVSTKTITQIKTILNPSPEPVGFVAEFVADGVVKNPEFTNVTTQEHIRVSGLTMQAGDSVRVSTMDNGRYVRLINEAGEKNVFNLMDSSSRFFKLGRGETTIQYTCDSGLEKLSFNIEFSREYMGI